jgi:sec-independent protein translocase protein TatA
MPNIGLPEILIVLVIALVVFGPKRLPELGRSVGKGFREFKGAVGGDDDDHDGAKDEPVRELSAAKAKPAGPAGVDGEIVTSKSP